MVEKTDSTVCKRFDGKDLATPIPYTYAWKEYADEAEFSAHGTEMTAKEQMKFRNTQAESKARAAAQTEALKAAGIEKETAATSTQVAMREMLKPMLVSKLPNGERKFTDEQARAIVESTYGEKFAE